MKKLLNVYEEITSLEGSLFIYSLAFSLLLALAPAIIVFVYMFNWMYLDTDIIFRFVSHLLPSELILPFIQYLSNNAPMNRITALVSMAVSLWLASRSIYSFLMISAKKENVPYPKWSIRIQSIMMFVFICGYVVACFYLTSKFWFFIHDSIALVYVGLGLLGFYLFYHGCSYIQRDKSYGIEGALFSTVAILLVGVLFFQIINQFTNYASIYGPISSLVILFLSVFVIANVIYIGYILNVSYADEEVHVIKENGFFRFCMKINQKIENYLPQSVKEK